MSDACIIIPARHASTRYPGKPLALLRGASGKALSLIERSVIAARNASGGEIPIYVATDDRRIADEAQRIGVDVIMTSPECRNGTERVAEAVRRAGIKADIIVNLQGDAPLTPPHFVTALIETLRANPDCHVATPCLRCDAETVENLLADRKAGRVGATTVVFNRRSNALYFSKEVLPFTNGKGMVDGVVPVFHHVGLMPIDLQLLLPMQARKLRPLRHSRGWNSCASWRMATQSVRLRSLRPAQYFGSSTIRRTSR